MTHRSTQQRVLSVASEAETQRVACRLASLLPAGTVIALQGTLGAGKTRFVQGIAAGLGIEVTEVMSPTYGLCHEHPGPAGSVGLNHLDLYRVADADELFELGFDEYIESPCITAIEWADRFPSQLPEPRLEIDLEVNGEETRMIRLRIIGESAELQTALAALT